MTFILLLLFFWGAFGELNNYIQPGDYEFFIHRYMNNFFDYYMYEASTGFDLNIATLPQDLPIDAVNNDNIIKVSETVGDNSGDFEAEKDFEDLLVNISNEMKNLRMENQDNEAEEIFRFIVNNYSNSKK